MNVTLLKNRSHPPGGWSYWCPKGEMDFPGGFAFDQQVTKIREYRAANPTLNLPSDLGSVRHELLLFTFLRLRRQLGLEKTMEWFSVSDTDDAEIAELVKKKLRNSPSAQPSDQLARPAGITKVIKDYAAGARILGDWIGEDKMPVSPELAQHRADICECCEYNHPGNWLQRLAGQLGGYIQEQMGVKHDMNLTVNNEARIFTCKVCSCHLPLLVWTPIETIAERTSAASLEKYPAHCWKAAEIHAFKLPTTIPTTMSMFDQIKPGMVAVYGSSKYEILGPVKPGDSWEGHEMENITGCKFWVKHNGSKIPMCFDYFDSQERFNSIFQEAIQPC